MAGVSRPRVLLVTTVIAIGIGLSLSAEEHRQPAPGGRWSALSRRYGADRKISLVKITSEKYHTSIPQYRLLVDVGGCCLARNVGQKRRSPGGDA